MRRRKRPAVVVLSRLEPAAGLLQVVSAALSERAVSEGRFITLVIASDRLRRARGQVFRHLTVCGFRWK
jgi:hypothetical protein